MSGLARKNINNLSLLWWLYQAQGSVLPWWSVQRNLTSVLPAELEVAISRLVPDDKEPWDSLRPLLPQYSAQKNTEDHKFTLVTPRGQQAITRWCNYSSTCMTSYALIGYLQTGEMIMTLKNQSYILPPLKQWLFVRLLQYSHRGWCPRCPSSLGPSQSSCCGTMRKRFPVSCRHSHPCCLHSVTSLTSAFWPPVDSRTKTKT